MKKSMNESEERRLLKSYDRGEWHSVKNMKVEILTLRTAARNTMLKDKRITDRRGV